MKLEKDSFRMDLRHAKLCMELEFDKDLLSNLLLRLLITRCPICREQIRDLLMICFQHLNGIRRQFLHGIFLPQGYLIGVPPLHRYSIGGFSIVQCKHRAT